MGWLKKLGKGIGKVVKSKIGKAVLGVVPGGGLVNKAVEVASSIGASRGTPRQSKSVVAAMAKLDQLKPLQVRQTPSSLEDVRPQTMPGGAPLRARKGKQRAARGGGVRPKVDFSAIRAKSAAKKANKPKRQFSEKQLAAQERFKAMVAAKRKK